MSKKHTSKKDILGYASKIWTTADTLRGVGIKESDFPAYMMPFFALMLLESRIVRMKKIKEEDKSLSPKDILEEIEEEGKGYNEVILKQGKTLKDICANDKTFEQDFHKYLQAFDQETKELLGIVYSEGEKFLDLKGYYDSLKSKKVGFSFVKDWSIIDLVDFDNSDITTLEEHIKRKWSDISAETAGEQYTPDDIINLIEDIVIDRFKEEKKRVINVYDMTCGGGNMLFGVADGIHEKAPSLTINTYGQELNSQLYALAKIESRFREGSSIEQGNTLTQDKFSGIGMDILVANPPYGVDWKEVLRTNELGELLPEQIEYIKEYISPVNKILELDGFFHETKQAGFVLKLINYKYNQKAVDKLYGYLLDIVEGIELVRVHHSIEKRFKVLPILDKRKGEKGSYSILIDEENNSYVYREYRTRPEMVLSDIPLDEAIKYASKKFYFYG